MVQGDNEGMVAGGQNLLLGQCSLDLVSLDHLLLAEDLRSVSHRTPTRTAKSLTFHRVQSTRLLLADQVDLSDITLAN